jgi:gliding motility-associated-like protein
MACYGTSYYAGGAWQTTAGTYVDTLQTPSGCDSVVTTHLSFKPEIPVDLGNNRYICPGETIVLSVSDSGATYEWQDGSTDTSFLVTEPGTYWVHVTKDQCIAGDTVIITECPSQLIFPNAFTPNEDGLNDVFRPKGISIGKFRMTIYDRWGMLLFETDDLEQGWNGIYKGEYCPAGVYSYTAVFEGTDEPGKQRRTSGSFTLVR